MRFHQAWDRLHLGFRLGITPRLVIAFAGVAALVLAANLLVEHGVLVERTTQITQTLPVPTMPPEKIAPVAVVVSPEPPLTVVPVERRKIFSDGLLLALDRYNEAVGDRLESKGESTEARYGRTLTELDRAAKEFLTTAATLSGRSFGKVSAAITAHERAAAELVTVADTRQALITKYIGQIESLNARSKGSLSNSWKIFGRVVARQSLLQLSADLDAYRHDATAFITAPATDLDLREKLPKAEQLIQKEFEVGATGLRHAQGDAWYESLRSDFATSVTLRDELLQTTDRQQSLSAEFSLQATQLVKLIPHMVEQALRAEPRVSAKHTADKVPADPVATAPLPAAQALPTTLPIVETHSVRTESPVNRSRRHQIAWISAATLALMLYVAIGTVLSIVRPVRRLLRATAQIAKGESDVQVPRGGIKELDLVAVAFNSMAAELSFARAAAIHYQHTLESKVEERTLQLKDLAEHDPLTGLPNRRELFVLLNAAIERAQAAGAQLGVFFLDIDNFKYINDSMGHAFGDLVLVALAKRLQATVQDYGFAARLGGDEFTVIFDRAENSDVIRDAGISIVRAFQEPLSVEGRDLVVSVSVGASIYPDHETSAPSLLSAADAALFRAKAMGRSQLSVFTPELLEAAAAKFTTEQGLRRALERGEFELLFQPEVSAETLETSLVEALIRWRMPDGSLASPGAFLAIAEESGLIIEISDWVLRAAIEAAAYWHHGLWPDVRVAVNVTPRQLVDVGFFNRMHSLLDAHKLPARCIEIELTESVLQTGPATIDALRRLRAAGVAIALDDFGTGYSSLASLEQLPLTRIKLDRSLIAGIDNSPRSAAITQAIIAMCQGLGLEITAEGIERPEQFAILQKHKGMYLQGYLLARPTSRDELFPVMARVTQQCQDLFLSTHATKTATTITPSPTPLRIVSRNG